MAIPLCLISGPDPPGRPSIAPSQASRPTVSWGTDFSGMDAMGYVMKEFETHVNAQHIFSCDLMGKQASFIRANWKPEHL